MRSSRKTSLELLSDLLLEDVDKDAIDDFLEDVSLGRGKALVGPLFDRRETELWIMLSAVDFDEPKEVFVDNSILC